MQLKRLLTTLGLLFSLIVIPSAVTALTETVSPKETHQAEDYKTIHAKELKEWIDSGKHMVLIDARPKKFEEGVVIKGAKFLPFDSDDAKIIHTLPSKDAVIVVYCASIKCPASGKLAHKLTSMGYKHVYKYPEGIEDWMDKDYPLDNVVPGKQ